MTESAKFIHLHIKNRLHLMKCLSLRFQCVQPLIEPGTLCILSMQLCSGTVKPPLQLSGPVHTPTLTTKSCRQGPGHLNQSSISPYTVSEPIVFILFYSGRKFPGHPGTGNQIALWPTAAVADRYSDRGLRGHAWFEVAFIKSLQQYSQGRLVHLCCHILRRVGGGGILFFASTALEANVKGNSDILLRLRYGTHPHWILLLSLGGCLQRDVSANLGAE